MDPVFGTIVGLFLVLAICALYPGTVQGISGDLRNRLEKLEARVVVTGCSEPRVLNCIKEAQAALDVLYGEYASAAEHLDSMFCNDIQKTNGIMTRHKHIAMRNLGIAEAIMDALEKKS